MKKTCNVHSKKDSPIYASSLKPDNVPASPSSQQPMSIAHVGSNNAHENHSRNLLTQPKLRPGRNDFPSRHKQSASKTVWRQKNQHEIKKDDGPKKNTNSFTDSRARAAVKTAASILGQDVTRIDDEKINKAASVVQNEYVHTMQTVFQAFCSDDEVNKIMDCYRQFFLEDKSAVEKIYYLRNYPPVINLSALIKILLSPNCNLIVIDLYDNNLCDEGIKQLSLALKGNKTVTHLEISRNSIGPQGVECLANVLPEMALVYLNIGDNHIAAMGAYYLAEVLAKTQIKHFKLYGNNINILGMKHLAKALPSSNLETLNLYGTNIGDEGADYLAQAIRDSQALSLSDLSVGNNSITAKGAEYIAKALSKKTVKITLDFSGNRLGNRGIDFLDFLPSSIIGLNLKRIFLNEKSARPLAKKLEKFACIEMLDIEGNKIGDEGVKEVITVLPDTITSLSLRATGMGIKSVIVLSSKFTTTMKSVVILNLSDNALGDDALRRLTEEVQTNIYLERLDVSSNSIGDTSIPGLITWLESTKLSNLQIGSNLLSAKGIEQLSKLILVVPIAVLSLKNNHVTYEGVQHLNHAIEQRRNKKQLTIDLEQNELKPEGLNHFLKSMAQLCVVEYNFGQNSLGDAGIISISDFISVHQEMQVIHLNLEKNNIGALGVDNLARALPTMQSLVKLTLDGNGLDEKAAEPLLQVLPKSTIIYFNISNNKLGDGAIVMMAKVLPDTQIRHLNLGDNSLGPNSGQSLGRVIPRTKLKQLDLKNNQLGSMGSAYIFDSLANSTLTYLDLTNNKLSCEGVRRLSEILPECHQLQVLYLKENGFKDEGAEYLSKGLRNNAAITALDISNNEISDDGMRLLMRVVVTTSITKLFLFLNNYGDKVFDDISEAIYQLKFVEKHLLIRDDCYSFLISNKKTNVERAKKHHELTSDEQKLLIFFVAPSCSGKSIFLKFLRENGVVDENVKFISTETFSDLPGYVKYKESGVRHPELKPDIYELYDTKRKRLISDYVAKGETIFVEMHLNNNEAKQISWIAGFAKKSGYWTAIAGLTVQPYKLFENARKSSKHGGVVDIKEVLSELKDFYILLQNLQFLDFRFLIDYNANLDNREKPFLIWVKTPQHELDFHGDALRRAKANVSLDVDSLTAQYNSQVTLVGEEKSSSDGFMLPSLKALADVNDNKPKMIFRLIVSLVPNKLVVCLEGFRKVQLTTTFSENQSNRGMIFIIRHAESEANVLTEVSHLSHVNDKHIGLTKKGYVQAVILAEYMSYICKIRNRKIQIRYSPAHRAIETMNVLLSRIGNYQATLKEYDCLRERSAGLFQGLTPEAREKQYPMQASFFEYEKEKNKFEASMLGGESPLDINLRLARFVRDCKQSLYENSDEDIIVVTHAKTSMVLRQMFCKRSSAWYNEQKEEPSNASVYVVANMPTAMQLTDKDMRDICNHFFKNVTDNFRVIFSCIKFLSSCLGYLNTFIEYSAGKSNITANEKFKEVLLACLQLNQQTVESRAYEPNQYLLLMNILIFGIRFIEETYNNGFQKRPHLTVQDLELFNSTLFEMVHGREMQASLAKDNLESAILPFSLNHQRRHQDYPPLVFFGNYFRDEPADIRQAAHIARKAEDKNGKRYTIKEQFAYAETWVTYMFDKNQGKLFENIIRALIDSNLKKNETVTIAYPVGEMGSSNNVIGLVIAEIIKKRLSVLIGRSRELSFKDISVITMPITQLTKTSRSSLNPFEKSIYRSYYNVSKIQGKVLLVDDDATTASSISEMISACRRNGNIYVIGCAVAAIIPGCEVLRIHPVVKSSLEHALRERYRMADTSFGPDDPVEQFNNILKGFGLCDGIDSLTNMMGIFQLAALYDPSEASVVVEKVWNESSFDVTSLSYQEICHIFNNDITLFPILGQIQKPALTTNEALKLLSEKADYWNRIKSGLDMQKECPRKFMSKYALPKVDDSTIVPDKTILESAMADDSPASSDEKSDEKEESNDLLSDSLPISGLNSTTTSSATSTASSGISLSSSASFKAQDAQMGIPPTVSVNDPSSSAPMTSFFVKIPRRKKDADPPHPSLLRKAITSPPLQQHQRSGPQVTFRNGWK